MAGHAVEGAAAARLQRRTLTHARTAVPVGKEPGAGLHPTDMQDSQRDRLHRDGVLSQPADEIKWASGLQAVWGTQH